MPDIMPETKTRVMVPGEYKEANGKMTALSAGALRAT